jgi:4'-phosphopantetheinyl transferase
MAETGPEGAGLSVDLIQQHLSEQEMKHFVAMRFQKRREEWLLGRLAVKSLLRQTMPELETVRDHRLTVANHDEGAPYVLLDGKQLRVVVSLSHRAKRAVAAVSLEPEIGLGIDLEWVEVRAASFYTDYFTAGELELLNQSVPEAYQQVGTILWSAKEAMLKALGKGLRLDTRSVEVLRIANYMGQYGWFPLEIHAPAMPQTIWRGFWRPLEGYVCTLAFTGIEQGLELRQVSSLPFYSAESGFSGT